MILKPLVRNFIESEMSTMDTNGKIETFLGITRTISAKHRAKRGIEGIVVKFERE